ncbi:MAG: hypothetical protein Q7K65_04410 [Candidatus Buchananbacteria bacterium]|nr:hypothetical protein [Candidatus Buchananbacteria bacterium]
MPKINIVMPICLQNDFIGPKGLASDRDIQHLILHGGKRAAARILGEASGPTPIDDVMEAIHNDDNTYVIYIEDQHPDDPNDPVIKVHFNIFGRHCVVGTEGVKAVGRLAMFKQLRRSQVINTDALNLVTHPPIVEAITAIIKENEIEDPKDVKFMVLGGLTDVLVADCARGLNHICGLPNPYREGGDRWDFFTQVIVPERYCFSNNATHHQAALQGMEKVAITIARNDAEIFDGLGIDA